MKIQLETIASHSKRTFTMMYNPRMSDLFYWHFHPEYELVYIKGANGTRHVGEHISTYAGSDLVLIGSNIPHLNFDYGVKTNYQKVVVHIKPEFINQHIQNISELNSLLELFEKSKHGVAFNGAIKNQVGKKLFQFEKLKPFEQYLQLIEILQSLTDTNEFKLLHETPYSRKQSDREQGRIRMIYAYVDKNYKQKIELNEIAALSNMTKEAFCRYFKKATNYTFVQFLNRYRISHAKRFLMSGKSVTEACYSCGFESLSYFNRIFKKITDENPSTFRKRYVENIY
ncbi:AraC family transcriptional regulator [Saprospiraceae bacterium]|nr:AraC family transcriptional regulator [bacterium]MDB4768559.1 AraC family transcriptional regulator [Saprospiraceae bacterium]